jgi:hypothetical protein
MQVLNSLDQQKSDSSVGQSPWFCGSTTDRPTTAHSADMHARGRRELRQMICHQQIRGLQTFATVAVFTCLERFSLTARISGTPRITRNRPSDAEFRGSGSRPATGVRQPRVRFLNLMWLLFPLSSRAIAKASSYAQRRASGIGVPYCALQSGDNSSARTASSSGSVSRLKP